MPLTPMSVASTRLSQEYARALTRLVEGDEAAAIAIRELGDEAVLMRIDLPELAQIHHEALTSIDVSRATASILARALTTFVAPSLAEREVAMQAARAELDAFNYSISHDLRAPLRSIVGFGDALAEDYAGALDARGHEYLGRVRTSALRLDRMLEGLLSLSRLRRTPLHRAMIDLSAIARAAFDEIAARDPSHVVQVSIEPNVNARADPKLLRILFDELASNVWKFTSKTSLAHAFFGQHKTEDGTPIFFVKDNGVGFGNEYAGKLFAPFRRLHGESEFPGVGLGLALAKLVVERHGGRVWAEGTLGAGMTLSFTLSAWGSS